MTPETPSDPQMRVVDLPGGPAGTTDVGAGAVLIAIHGMPGSVRDWRWLGPVVEGPLRFIRLDLPGFGATPGHTVRGRSPGHVAVFVIQVADALEIERFTVVGQSWGGTAALRTAAAYPDRVAGVALISSAGTRPHRGWRHNPTPRTLSPLLRLPIIKTVMRGPIRSAFTNLGFSAAVPLEDIYEGIHYAGTLGFDQVARDVERVSAPTLVAWADDDRVVEAEIGADLASRAPAGPRLHFGTGGHNLQKSMAVEIGQALIEWMPQLCSGG